MHRPALVFVLLAGTLAHADSGPRLWYGAPVIKGKLDAKVVAAAVAKSEAPLLECFLKNADPSINDGMLTASFTVQLDGALANVTAAGLGRGVETCITGVLAKVKLDKLKETVTVSYPLSFVRDMTKFASITGTGGTDGVPALEGDSVGTLGHGAGWGVGSDGNHGRPARLPPVKLGLPTVKGDLDKAIIRRYIKRHIQKVIYCYEKQLLVDAKLAGTVTAEFTIDAEGKVTAAKASGMNKTVAACIQTVIENVTFPKPKTAEVTVSYPFIFQPAVEKPKPKPAKK